jgi:chromosome segregation ATPase
MTELERLDAEMTRLEGRISFLDDQFFELQRRADLLRDQVDKENDPLMKAELTAQLGRTVAKIDDNRDEHQQTMADADEVGRALRAETAFQESLKASPPAADDGEGDSAASEDSGDDWLERRRLARERKRKMKP